MARLGQVVRPAHITVPPACQSRNATVRKLTSPTAAEPQRDGSSLEQRDEPGHTRQWYGTPLPAVGRGDAGYLFVDARQDIEALPCLFQALVKFGQT